MTGKRRYLRAQDLPFWNKTGENGLPLCPWCGKESDSRKRRWCKKGCVEEFKTQNWANRIEALVWRRDKGVCARCHLDCRAFGNALACIRNNNTPLYGLASQALGVRAGWRYQMRGRKGPLDRRFWEIDHIVEVERGGSNELANLCTLCRLCHQEKTSMSRCRTVDAAFNAQIKIDQNRQLVADIMALVRFVNGTPYYQIGVIE